MTNYSAEAFDPDVNDDLVNFLVMVYNLCDNLIRLFGSIIVNRSQYVEHKRFRRNTCITSNGVIQGSNLGPILFLAFLRMLLGNALNCHVFVYADDLKIASRIRSNVDCFKLQDNKSFMHGVLT